MAVEQKAEPPHPAADASLPLIRSGVWSVPAGVRGKPGYGESGAAYLLELPSVARPMRLTAAKVVEWVGVVLAQHGV